MKTIVTAAPPANDNMVEGCLLPPATNRFCVVDGEPFDLHGAIPVPSRDYASDPLVFTTADIFKADKPTVPAPPPAELHLGTQVYSLADWPESLITGRVCGLSDRYYVVLWEDGFRNQYTRCELLAVADVLEGL